MVGALPSKRKGANIRLVAGELVLWGGDKSEPITCVVADSEWKWVVPTMVGVAPPPRAFCSASVLQPSALVVYYGGLGLTDNSELSDLVVLARTEQGWEWRQPAEEKGYLKPVEKEVEVCGITWDGRVRWFVYRVH